MAENERVFRNAFNGYNKEDVNTYIASLAEDTKNAVDAAQLRAQKAESDLENIAGELEDTKNKLVICQEEAKGYSEELSACK